MQSCRYCFLIFSVFLLVSCSPIAQPKPNGSTSPHPYSIEKAKGHDQIVMGWNAFGTTDTYIEQNNVQNLNVVSPRWFSLSADQVVKGEVDQRYVEWAHSNGKQVWAFIGNKFDPELTDSVLSDPDNHRKVADYLEAHLVKHKVDGLNIDFENIKEKNKADYVAFVQYLKNRLSPQGIIISVDITRENPDPMWSGSYDRRELGKAADYIIMMGYDEDLGGGGKVGSVASLPWVEEGIQLLLNDVPANKIILAIPFYMREWVTDLTTQVQSPNDRTMVEAEELIQKRGLQKKWDDEVRQHYVEFHENNEKHQMWVEDEHSVKERLKLVQKYQLKGIAAWYVGQESPQVWELMGVEK